MPTTLLHLIHNIINILQALRFTFIHALNAHLDMHTHVYVRKLTKIQALKSSCPVLSPKSLSIRRTVITCDHPSSHWQLLFT